MTDNHVLDLGNSAIHSNMRHMVEELGRFALQMQENETEMQRISQNLMRAESQRRAMESSFVSPEDLHQAFADCVPKPIVPEGYFEKTQEYQQRSLEILESINQNTANLYTLVELISKSNEQQDEVIALITEILALAKAKSKSEAQTLFTKVMGKITTATSNAEALMKLASWTMSVYNVVIPMLEARGIIG